MNNNTNHLTENLKPTDHFSYFLRLWRSNGQWRAFLETLETGKRIGFASLEQLFAYLMEEIEGRLNKQCNPGKEHMDETGKRN